MEIINPQLKDIERKQAELQNTMAEMRGELNELKRTASDTSRQTIWQFIIFTVTISAVLLGAVKFQTDNLRREMEIRFSAQSQEINTRFDIVEKRLEAMEKGFESLKQEVRASRN